VPNVVTTFPSPGVTAAATQVSIPTPSVNPTDEALFSMEAAGHMTRVARQTVVALTPSLPPPTYGPYHTPLPVDLPLGIVGHPTIGMHICDCTYENLWRGRLPNGDYIDVIAGAYTLGGESGILIIDTMTPNLLGTTGFEFYSTPIETRSVHIVSYNGMQLTLHSTEGTQLVFDALTRTWISPPVTPTTVQTVSP